MKDRALYLNRQAAEIKTEDRLSNKQQTIPDLTVSRVHYITFNSQKKKGGGGGGGQKFRVNTRFAFRRLIYKSKL